jgi:hypothetical protein
MIIPPMVFPWRDDHVDRGDVVDDRSTGSISHLSRLGHIGQPPSEVGSIDIAGATRAVADLLDALGIDRENESLRGTPARVACAFAELLTPEPFDATTFPNDEGYDELVVVLLTL